MVAAVIRQEEFEGTQLAVIEKGGEEWFTAEDIGKALGYAQPTADKINNNKLYLRNKDEFMGISVTAKLTGTDGKFYSQRVFNAQACIKFGFFAKTAQAKAFRHWASRFLTKGVKVLKDKVEADHRLIDELQAEIERQSDKELSKISWDTLEEVPDWIWGFNGRIKTLEKEMRAVKKELEAKPKLQVPAQVPQDKTLIPVQDLRRLRDLAAPKNFLEANRIMHSVLRTQAEWDALYKLTGRK